MCCTGTFIPQSQMIKTILLKCLKTQNSPEIQQACFEWVAVMAATSLSPIGLSLATYRQIVTLVTQKLRYPV